jgi:hypothetical protein
MDLIAVVAQSDPGALLPARWQMVTQRGPIATTQPAPHS